MIKSIFELSKLHEILIRANFCSTEQAIAFEKQENIYNILNYNSEGIFRNKMDRWNAILSKIKCLKSLEILSWTNFLSLEKAIQPLENGVDFENTFNRNLEGVFRHELDRQNSIESKF